LDGSIEPVKSGDVCRQDRGQFAFDGLWHPAPPPWPRFSRLCCPEMLQRWPELPVMMVTAYGHEERRRRADEYGAAEFLTKPVDFASLKERLRQLPTSLP
jgi:CheY-like chemotaxis protein